MPSNEYMNEYMQQRYFERRQYAIALLGGKCVICDSTENLEIDHIDRATKSFNISKMWSINEEAYLAELEKCQLLCKEHHKEKTGNELSVVHGQGLTGRRNCYCELCKPLKLAYNRNRKFLYR